MIISKGVAMLIWYLAVSKERRCSVEIQVVVTKKFLTRGCILQYQYTWKD